MRSADKPGADCLLAVKVNPASPSTARDVERIKHAARLSESAGMSLLVPRRLRCELGSMAPFNGVSTMAEPKIYEVAEGSTIDLEWEQPRYVINFTDKSGIEIFVRLTDGQLREFCKRSEGLLRFAKRKP